MNANTEQIKQLKREAIRETDPARLRKIADKLAEIGDPEGALKVEHKAVQMEREQEATA